MSERNKMILSLMANKCFKKFVFINHLADSHLTGF